MEYMKEFTPTEHETWNQLYSRLNDNRVTQAHPIFAEGLMKLGMRADHIPKLDEINKRLEKLTGWNGVPAEGLEEGKDFFHLLANKKFPIGNFIRDNNDLNYTPAPDVFHDLYGHIPFFANKDYADSNALFGHTALKHVDDPVKLRKLERVYWFGFEFPLIKTANGRRIFGAGILSSFGESNYCLSPEPKVLPFDLKTLSETEFRIDIFQEVLFELESPEQLYKAVENLESVL